MTETRTIAVMGRVLDQQDGLGVYSLHLLRHLFTLDRATRYLLLLRSPRAQDEFRDCPNVQARVLPASSKLWWDQAVVPRAARDHGAHLSFNPKFSIPLLTCRPCAFVLQGADWFVNPANYAWWDNLYIRLMLPLYCRKATQILAISQAALADLRRRISID